MAAAPIPSATYVSASSYREMTRRGYACLGAAEIPLFAPEQYSDEDFPGREGVRGHGTTAGVALR
jgi:hypothetical protein